VCVDERERLSLPLSQKDFVGEREIVCGCVGVWVCMCVRV